VEVYVGLSPGGGYSTFAQILVHHMGRHIPGNPNVIVKHMPGAGGLKALNYVYNAAAKDGTVLITPDSGPTRRVVLGIGNTKYDPVKYNWLGGWSASTFVLTVLNTAPVKTLEEAMETEVILGAIAKGNTSYQNPVLINNTLGTKFKIIPGYRGGARVRLAMEKGEVQGWCGQYMGWKSRKPEWIREGKLVHLVQLAQKRHPDMPDVPRLTEFARNDEQRQMFEFVQAGIEDRTLAAPPGVPADRLAALEKAYMDTLNDPEFRADAAKKKYDIDPQTREEILATIKTMMAMSPDLVAKLKVALEVED
jgi:tripartite-type tricarboxylate transporter receptor subunit TctC